MKEIELQDIEKLSNKVLRRCAFHKQMLPCTVTHLDDM